MSPLAQRIAIAEACGWRRQDEAFYFQTYFLPPGDGGCALFGVSNDDRPHIPDYLNDMNAMHSALVTLKQDARQYIRYCEELTTLAGGGTWDAYFCTAAEQAKAFLRAKNLWTE